MSVIVFCLGVIATMIGVSALTGLGILLVLRTRWLLRGRLENLLAWVFLGLGWWVLAYGWLNYLGLSARQLRWPLLAFGLSWCTIGLWKGRGTLSALWQSLRQRLAETVVFAIACLLSLAGILIRVHHFEWVNPLNDNLTYASLATYLQDHSFGAFISIARDPQHTVAWYAAHEGSGGFRMGATWLLALLQALTGRDALLVSQPLMGLGILLNLAGVYLLARWVVRLAWLPATGVVLFAAAVGSPLQASVILGFQGQIFGTAYFVFVLALLARCLAPSHWTAGTALIVALATTAFLSIYHDMAPLLALIALGTVAILIGRAWRAGLGRRFGAFALITLVGLLVLGNVEWARSYTALRGLVGCVVGWEIPWTWMGYLQFALGIAPRPYSLHSSNWQVAAAVLLLSAFALTGVVCLMRRRNWLMLQSLTVIALLTVYFSCMRDPFTGHLGHRWSLFKLANWAYPVVVILPFVGLAWLRSRLGLPRLVFLVPGIVVVLVGLGRRTGESKLAEMMGTRRPEDRRLRLQAYLAQGGFDSVCLADPGIASPHLQSLAGYFVYPLPIRHGWFGSGLCEAGDQDPDFDLGEKTLVMTWCEPPFETPQERLPLKLNRLDVSRPHVFFLENPAGAGSSHLADDQRTLLTEQPARLHLWTPRAARAVLVLHLEAGTTNSTAWQVHLKGERAGLDQQLEVRGSVQVSVPVTLPAGRSRVELSCKASHDGGSATLTLRHAELRFGSSSAPAAVTRR
jgi:hypothetical protein